MCKHDAEQLSATLDDLINRVWLNDDDMALSEIRALPLKHFMRCHVGGKRAGMIQELEDIFFAIKDAETQEEALQAIRAYNQHMFPNRRAHKRASRQVIGMYKFADRPVTICDAPNLTEFKIRIATLKQHSSAPLLYAKYHYVGDKMKGQANKWHNL